LASDGDSEQERAMAEQARHATREESPDVALAAAWADALNGTYRDDLGRLLARLSRELLTAVNSGRSRADLAEAAGRTLAAHDQAARDQAGSDTTNVGSLPATVRVLSEHLPKLAPGAGASAGTDAGAGLSAALDAFTRGYLAECEAARQAEARALRYLSRTLLHHATHDPLTGLPNRTALMGRLETAQAGAFGVCYLDLDGFKAVNDLHGHHTGDRLLVSVAERISRVASVHGVLAARIGGDEFVVLAEGPANLGGMVALARDLLDEIGRTGSDMLRVTACAGIAVSSSAATVIADADAALYQAKALGPGRWAVHETDRETTGSTQARSMAASIQAGLQRGEFRIGYLPVFGLRDGEFQGAEAVPVWQHPALGELTAEIFLPLAEGTAAAPRLASWLLDTVLTDASAWRLEGSTPYVGVMLPAGQRVQPPPYATFLRLDLPETALAERRPAGRHRGANVGIRGFGAGSAGLARLGEVGRLTSVTLHPDVTTDERVVTALANVAHAFGIRVIASNVTDRRLAGMLTRAGCDAAHGPLFGGPVSAAAIATLAHRAKAGAAALVSSQGAPFHGLSRRRKQAGWKMLRIMRMAGNGIRPAHDH
jgi:diguanylate cyclase